MRRPVRSGPAPSVLPRGTSAALRALAILPLVAVLGACQSGDERADAVRRAQRLDLINIDYDEDVRQGAERLQRHLQQELGLQDIDIKPQGYDAAVRTLIDPSRDVEYVAWVTPYVYVVAEMLGAEFEVVGTYRSQAVLDSLQKAANGDGGGEAEAVAAGPQEGEGYTYRSYFVVNRADMERILGERTEAPGLPALEEYLRVLERRGEEPEFFFHSKFSTSSFFLPSVYFRDQGMIDVIRARDIRVSLGKMGESVSSKRLVERVAKGAQPAIAAVWDGTKTAFESGDRWLDYGQHVHFIPLDEELPNDLLVVSASMSLADRERISDAIASMEPAGPELDTEFRLWRPIDAEVTRKARSALVGLRQLAREQIAPVTVMIEEAPGSKNKCFDPGSRAVAEAGEAAVLRKLRNAAEDAVRLSGTEFVLWNEFFEHNDFRWSLGLTHDGAVKLCSRIEGMGTRWDQEFLISYEDPTDLTERVGDLIRSRMNRLRHVWPYSKDETPTILRDVDFEVAVGERVQVQKIRWLDREHNNFRDEGTFDAQVLRADKRKFELSSQGFSGGFDPMGSLSYRAVLPRPSEERPLFTILTAVLLVLFLAATVAAVLDLRRAAAPVTAAPTDLVAVAFGERVRKIHEPWRAGAARELADADVLGQDRDAIEELIGELKLAEGPWVKRLVARLTSAKEESDEEAPTGLTRELLVDRQEIRGTTRLANLLEYLARRNHLSRFAGTALEFKAWDEAARELFSSTLPDGERLDDESSQLLSQRSASLTHLVSTHFDRVLQEAMRLPSLFCRVWETHKDPGGGLGWVFRRERELPVALDHHCKLAEIPRGELIRRMVVEFKFESHLDLTLIEGQHVEAWLLGILNRRPSVVQNAEGESCLRLRFKPLAMFRGPAC